MFMPIVYWAIIAAILIYVSKRTVFGRQVIAVGSNERAAQLSGVNVDRVKIGAYALMGVLVGIACDPGFRIGSMDFATAAVMKWMPLLQQSLVAQLCVVAGNDLGTVLGMLIIAVMNNLLNLFGVPPFLREAFKGLIVVLAVLFQRKESA